MIIFSAVMICSDVLQVSCYQNQFFVYQVGSDEDSPEANTELVTETILCVCRNYPEVLTQNS